MSNNNSNTNQSLQNPYTFDLSPVTIDLNEKTITQINKEIESNIILVDDDWTQIRSFDGIETETLRKAGVLAELTRNTSDKHLTNIEQAAIDVLRHEIKKRNQHYEQQEEPIYF